MQPIAPSKATKRKHDEGEADEQNDDSNARHSDKVPAVTDKRSVLRMYEAGASTSLSTHPISSFDQHHVSDGKVSSQTGRAYRIYHIRHPPRHVRQESPLMIIGLRGQARGRGVNRKTERRKSGNT
jgi:hypothetical protein